MNDIYISSNSVDITTSPLTALRNSFNELCMTLSNMLKRWISCNKTVDNDGNRPLSSSCIIVKCVWLISMTIISFSEISVTISITISSSDLPPPSPVDFG